MKILKTYEQLNYWKIELQDAVASCCRDYIINTISELESLTLDLLNRLNIKEYDFNEAVEIVRMFITDNIDEWAFEIENLIDNGKISIEEVVDFIYDVYGDTHELNKEEIEEYVNDYIKQKNIKKFKI